MFKRPSEMKKNEGSPFNTPRAVSNGLASRPGKPPPADSRPPPVESKKPAKPPPAPKTTRISEMMRKFEKSPGPEQGTPSQSPSPQHDVVSPTHRSDALAPPPRRTDPDTSPLSGRKFNKKESYGDLKKKFEEGPGGGHSDRSASPSSRGSSRATSPDTGKPSYPHKPGSNVSPPLWAKNRDKPFVKSPSPHDLPAKPLGGDRPMPPWKKEPPKPEQQPPVARESPKPSRRFPPPPGPAPPEPQDESERIEEEDESDSKQPFVYK